MSERKPLWGESDTARLERGDTLTVRPCLRMSHREHTYTYDKCDCLREKNQ